uniref:Uncharacterized protein n=1 Tax=Chromera velia CCMP2878 TaxID=1169474 RepID=A0A0G4FTP4_9ALVE|eukprot:Cvel_18580.t1-p1 / transcript=Cvel_18580.t1 / gene=Cvel_18580 / organism=Chromera_velia_CCMP2878 / gene_product=hypothetical protein / transcript_product=hypothetical protein / location=Cvel_scaffold1549:28728-29789(-) / protein_length=354 / sequence_SO=supercontig / SO=protein_coding / is_pseudo=false
MLKAVLFLAAYSLVGADAQETLSLEYDFSWGIPFVFNNPSGVQTTFTHTITESVSATHTTFYERIRQRDSFFQFSTSAEAKGLIKVINVKANSSASLTQKYMERLKESIDTSQTQTRSSTQSITVSVGPNAAVHVYHLSIRGPGIAGSTDRWAVVPAGEDPPPVEAGEATVEYELNLRHYHDACTNPAAGDGPNCVAAISRACQRAGFSGGFARRVQGAALSYSCLRGNRHDVPFQDLHAHHSGCVFDQSNGSSCRAAAKRWCSANGHGGNGIIQEIGPSSFGVMCWNPAVYTDVPYAEIPGCFGSATGDMTCIASVNNWCTTRHGLTTGIVQEIGTGVRGIGCVAGSVFAKST